MDIEYIIYLSTELSKYVTRYYVQLYKCAGHYVYVVECNFILILHSVRGCYYNDIKRLKIERSYAGIE